MKKTLFLLLLLAVLLLTVACEDTPTQSQAVYAPFSVHGVTVAPDAEAAPILAALGEPQAFAETNSCYGDGKDKVYEYPSFKVQTYSMGGIDYILSVEIHSDVDTAVATAEGIRIGSTADAVLQTYGTAQTQTETQILYTDAAAKTKLQFLLRNGIVTNIQYLKTA